MKIINKWPMASVSSSTLILVTAAFVAAFSNNAFFAEAWRAFDSSTTGALFFASLYLFVTSLFVLVLSAVCHRETVKPFIVAFLMSSAIGGYFTSKYGTVFDYQMIANALETNTSEARDLFSLGFFLHVIVLGLLPSLIVAFVPMQRPLWRTETTTRLRLAAGASATLVMAVLLFSGHYASMFREHRQLVMKVTPTYAMYSTIKLAVRSLPERSRKHQVVGSDALIPPTDLHRELVIMVVGETVRADHWQLNGYGRETTPKLARENVINFPDFWSCGTSTAHSVPCMFSHLGRDDFNVTAGQFQDNALDILKRAGVSVLWRDNNSSSKGVADRVGYEDFKSPRLNPSCDHVECRDEGMLSGLQEHINEQSGDVLIVLHQMGNHGPAYYKRYPKAFERFAPACQTNDLGACSSEEITNAYDNAILYTDHFLSQVIDFLKKNGQKFETAMFYVSDHGESLGEYGVYLHGMPYLMAPKAQKHVPAVIWLGESIKHDLILDNIDTKRRQHWSHDNVFATLLGLFEVDSAIYDPTRALLTHKPLQEAKTE